MGDTVYLDDKRLRDLIRACKGKVPSAKVGIIASKDTRKDGKATNAEIGAAHEFGTQHLPMRSFLRMPLATQLNKYLESSGAFTRQALDQVAETKSLDNYVKKIAVVAEGVVQEAFATGGFGQWPPWQTPNYTNNANMLLVDSAQLRNSIGSEVS